MDAIQETPTIEINGKKHSMPKPKIKLWRQIIKFHEKLRAEGIGEEQALDEVIGIVVTAFKHPDITPEVVEEELGLEDLKFLFNYIRQQVVGMANGKAAQIPNAGTPARKKT